MTSRVREAHLALADERAIEKEAERYNPVNPKQMLNNRKENMGRLSGQGATPSMGLSEYRGGKKLSKKMLGDAHNMGKHLSTHLMELHGGAFHHAFVKGMGYGDDEPEGYTRPVHTFDSEGHRVVKQSPMEKRAEQAKENYNARAGVGEKLAQGAVNALSKGAKYAYENAHKVVPAPGVKEAGQFVSDHLIHSGSGYGQVQRAKMMLGENKKGRSRNNGPPLLSGNVDGVWSGGNMLSQPLPVNGTNLSLSGSSMTGAYEGQGKKAKRVVGAGDGRRKRAEVVKKVMREKGMKMIEASKYVKQHNLY